ncbi:hypothetical protein [Lacticaseibacillus hulanensis]|uniref:hypothetical protein n=1 Tax=Lacticaseibacillus hulanensis TaxID=2493111 RepID=UPI000FD73174|nr:hypothetical protein [Lacticaseibacillus hulanensis]
MFGLFAEITLRFTALGVIVFIWGIINLLMSGHKKRAMWDLGVFIILALLCYGWVYIVLPEPSMSYTVISNLVSLVVAAVLQAGFAVNAVMPKVSVEQGKVKVSRRDVTPSRRLNASVFGKVAGWGVALAVVAIAVFAALNVSEAKKVANLAPVAADTSTAKAPMPVVSGKNKEVPVVNTPATVLTQINNSLSNIPNANVYDVSHVRVQILHKKMTYIAPIDFDGSFFRFMRYKKVDGYFAVDATSKTAQPKFVKKSMYYTPAAFFSKDVRRLMYAHSALSSYVLMNNTPQLEVDEQGTPYYVATLVHRYGVTNRQDFRKKAIVTINAETGAAKVYKNLASKPKWLDVALDPSTAASQVDAWARERNGWWNANGIGGARNGVMVAVTGSGTEGDSDEVTPVQYGNQIYYLEALTSARSSQTSVMGYAFTDAATGKSYYYRENKDAMTPDRAQKLAKDMMKQTGWQPKMPMLYRIDGRPTWVVSMLDSSHAFRSYVYLLASGNGTQDTVATGSDATDTLAKYRALFGATTASGSGAGKLTKVSGAILRVSRNGDYISFLLSGKKIVYTVSAKSDPFAPFMQAGDQVSFKARVSGTTGTVEGGVQNAALTQKK